MKRFVFYLIVIFLMSFSIGSQPLPSNRSLTLEEAIDEALKNNLDLRIEITNPDYYLANIQKNTSIFSPTFGVNVSTNSQKNPSASLFEGGTIATNMSDSFNSYLSQRLPIGGTLQVSFYTNKSESTSKLSTFNPQFNSRLTFNLTQPILKNFGTLATKRAIYSARNSYQKSLLTLKQKVIDLIYQVEDSYWKLVQAYESYEVQKKSLQLAKDQLSQREMEVKIGVSAQMDVLAAQAEAASRESSLLQAWKNIQTTEENLKRILNISRTLDTVQPTDKPTFEAKNYQFEELLAKARANRPDIQQVHFDLKDLNLTVKYTRSQLLPELNLIANYYSPGLSGTQLDPDIFGGGDPVIVNKTNWSKSINDSLKNLYQNYTIQLQFLYPITNASARSDYKQSKIQLQQGLLRLENTENTVYSEVKQLLLNLETQIKIVEASRIARELAEQKLLAEQKKLSVGLSTDFNVIQSQRDLATNQSLELEAIINYNLLIANMSKVLGTTLDKHNFSIAGLEK